MTRLLHLFIILLAAIQAQGKPGHFCAETQSERFRKSGAKVKLASPLLNQYDVKHVALDLQISNLTTAISGNAATTAVVTDSLGMARYTFELSDQLTIDSVKINGLRLAPLRIDTDLYAVTVPIPLQRGTRFTAQVFYHGRPTSGTGFFTRGLNHNVLTSGTEITFTLSDPDLAKDWWPCKQVLTDKIDSADLAFTVPPGTKAGSNGLLQGIRPLPAGERFEWKTRYPIEYYLISVSVAPYVEHSNYMQFSGSGDSMLLQHFIYDTVGQSADYIRILDSTADLINYFSGLFGRYPFDQEKYGHCLAPLGGGMEHQTMSTIGEVELGLIAHELGHQWWGDHVTYRTWQDIWLSEGWATYCAELYEERFIGPAAARATRTTNFNTVMTKGGGRLYVVDTTDARSIFDGRLTYAKGASVAHMLRYLAPSDSIFFSGLRAFQRQYAYQTATTADFQVVMETAYGRSLDTFFRQWVYGEGFPTYTATWNQVGTNVFISLEQSTSVPSSVAAFNMPVTFRLTSATGDTLVKLPFSTANTLFRIPWGRTMNNLIIDPNNDILNRANPVFRDEALNIGRVRQDELLVYPNPSEKGWQLTGIAKGTSVQLLDAGGKVAWEAVQAPASLVIDSSSLAPGMYTLVVRRENGSIITRKLEKR